MFRVFRAFREFREFRVFRELRVFSVGFQGLVERFNFGFGGTKTTRNVTWGSILTPCRKNAQNIRKIEVWTKVR